MLILYGVLFILVENRRTAPHVTRLEQITYREAFIAVSYTHLDVYKRQAMHRHAACTSASRARTARPIWPTP